MVPVGDAQVDWLTYKYASKNQDTLTQEIPLQGNISFKTKKKSDCQKEKEKAEWNQLLFTDMQLTFFCPIRFSLVVFCLFVCFYRALKQNC